MERIRQALDRAREDRKTRERSAGPELFTEANVDASYGKTRVVEVDPAVSYRHRIITSADQGQYIDAYKILRTKTLQRLLDNGWKTLAVTSTNAREGKTHTAINLAVCVAMEVNYSVMLVEANLLHPNMHEFFGLPQQQGLSEFLLGEVELPELLFRPSIFEHLVILPGGRPLVNSAEMLNSPRFVQLVEELKNRYPNRYIIFDLPPVLASADVVAFSPYVDAALMVIEEGRTKEPDLVQAIELLERTHVIGTILNKVPVSS